MLTGPVVILMLKIAVSAVTVLLLTSLAALWLGKYRLHGRINLLFFSLTILALVGFEGIIRIIKPEIFDYFQMPENADLNRALSIHLWFAIPSALLMPAMLSTGLKKRRNVHLSLAVLFGVLWTGTFVTGIFFLPHR